MDGQYKDDDIDNVADDDDNNGIRSSCLMSIVWKIKQLGEHNTLANTNSIQDRMGFFYQLGVLLDDIDTSIELSRKLRCKDPAVTFDEIASYIREYTQRNPSDINYTERVNRKRSLIRFLDCIRKYKVLQLLLSSVPSISPSPPDEGDDPGDIIRWIKDDHTMHIRVCLVNKDIPHPDVMRSRLHTTIATMVMTFPHEEVLEPLNITSALGVIEVMNDNVKTLHSISALYAILNSFPHVEDLLYVLYQKSDHRLIGAEGVVLDHEDISQILSKNFSAVANTLDVMEGQDDDESGQLAFPSNLGMDDSLAAVGPLVASCFKSTMQLHESHVEESNMMLLDLFHNPKLMTMAVRVMDPETINRRSRVQRKSFMEIIDKSEFPAIFFQKIREVISEEEEDEEEEEEDDDDDKFNITLEPFGVKALWNIILCDNYGEDQPSKRQGGSWFASWLMVPLSDMYYNYNIEMSMSLCICRPHDTGQGFWWRQLPLRDHFLTAASPGSDDLCQWVKTAAEFRKSLTSGTGTDDFVKVRSYTMYRLCNIFISDFNEELYCDNNDVDSMSM